MDFLQILKQWFFLVFYLFFYKDNSFGFILLYTMERKECINYYELSFFSFWYDIKATYQKQNVYRWWWIIITYTRDNVVYKYSFYSNLSEKDRKIFAETFVNNFNPDEVHPINEKYEMQTFSDGAVIKSLESDKSFTLDWKRNRFIREKKQMYNDVFNIIIEKKITLKKLPDEEFFALWVKERENNNLYVPQIENLFPTFESMIETRYKIDSIIDFEEREKTEEKFSKTVSLVVATWLQNIVSKDYHKEKIEYIKPEIKEKEEPITVNDFEEKKETKKKKFDWSVIWNVFVLIFTWIFSVIWFIFTILIDNKKSKKKK